MRDCTLCRTCGELYNQGHYCPVCDKVYPPDDLTSKMVQCGTLASLFLLPPTLLQTIVITGLILNAIISRSKNMKKWDAEILNTNARFAGKHQEMCVHKPVVLTRRSSLKNILKSHLLLTVLRLLRENISVVSH